jgi:putative membrane protein
VNEREEQPERVAQPDLEEQPPRDPTRRTWLAAERTWLAWWRTGIASAAVAVAIGGLVPRLGSGAKWPYVVLGAGYAVVAIAVLLAGAVRQQRLDAALDEGRYDRMSHRLVAWLTAAGVALGVVTFLVIVFA